MAYTPVYCTAQQVYNKTGLSATEIDLSTNVDIIEDAEAELEALTGKKWTNGVSKTDYFNGISKDIIGTSGNYSITINTTCYPIQSITSFLLLNTDGTTNTTFDNLTSVQISAGTYYTDDYWLETSTDSITNSLICSGKIILKETNFSTGTQNIKISYTYGYSTVPALIRALACCLAGIRAWVNFLGGNYNRINSYMIPQQTVNKGDFYARGIENIQSLHKEANDILDRVGRKSRLLFTSSSGVK